MEIKNQNAKIKMQNDNLKLKIKPEIRFLDDIKKVLYDQEWAKLAENFPIYYMYRGLEKKNDLRYDITIIPNRMLGKEFVKTKGNRNSNNFQELYTVLEGEALFLLQKMKNKIVKEILVIKTQKNESVIVSPEYIVVAINPCKKKLIMGNWVSKKNKNIYDEIKPFNGMAYFYTKNGWIKNKNYKKIPKLRFKKPLKKEPKDLNFLNADVAELADA